MTSDDFFLRPVIETDLPVFYEQQLDPLATRMANFPARMREEFFAHWAEIMIDESVLLRTVVWDGQVAGNVLSFNMEGKREVGYWFGRAYWGKGLASRALAEFLNIETRRPLYAYTDLGNAGSQRVLEKCAFKRISAQERWLIYILEA
jgi:RimJ/RimL family protein N-acetyltransferase